MNKITFITGNQGKADALARYLGLPLDHQKVDIDELQTLDLKSVVEHKVKSAYKVVQSPVLVEDSSLEFNALGRLPGTFIKYFVDEVDLETQCRMLDSLGRSATARCAYAYYDGNRLEVFESHMEGSIAEHPTGEGGFGWDSIFIPDGFNQTKAQLSEADYKKVYLTIKPIMKVKAYLESL